MPTIVMPQELTNPLTSGLGADDKAHAPASSASPAPDGEAEAPYSVEGGETLDPDTN
jgi:hypothetical protein